MPKSDGTVRSRELGEGLRRAMEQASYTGVEIARKLGWSQSWVSRLLTGHRGATEVQVSAFLALCQVTGQERDRLLALCDKQNTPGWLQQHGSRLPKQLQTLITHEDLALEYCDVQPILVPGLLQTRDYSRAVIEGSANFPSDEVDDRVTAQMARQNLFARDRPPRFTFFIHESALYLEVGGQEVMSDQLHHLLRMSVRGYLDLRVVPRKLGVHAAVAGPFIFMEFAEITPVVYLESETSSLFLEKPEEVAAYRRILAALANTALDQEQSRERIAALATELYADREGLDDHA